MFPKSLEHQGEVPNFSSRHAELQNTSQQEILSYSIGKLVSPPLFDKIDDPI